MKRMEWFIDCYLQTNQKLKVLDVGSYDVNGCYKNLFEPNKFNYIGLDMEKGPNVDLVPKSAYKWKELKDDSFNVVISGQAIEHVEFFWVTIGEMVRVTKEGGLICIIAPNGFGEHRYPVDCWRFFTDGMIALARYYKLEIMHAHTNSAPSFENHEWYSEDCGDSMIIARKPYSGEARVIDLNKYKCVPENHQTMGNGMKTYLEYKDYTLTKVQVKEGGLTQRKKGLLKKIKERKKIINNLINKAARVKEKTICKIKRALKNQP
jgi:SAM-dependent methyltransferase